MIEKHNKYIPLKTTKRNDLIKLLLYEMEAGTLTIREIATSYRVRPQLVYTIVRDFEALGFFKIDRNNRRLVLNEKAITIIGDELERRGYLRSESYENA
jgi:DNA-binding MarR family transcriptional regulator